MFTILVVLHAAYFRSALLISGYLFSVTYVIVIFILFFTRQSAFSSWIISNFWFCCCLHLLFLHPPFCYVYVKFLPVFSFAPDKLIVSYWYILPIRIFSCSSCPLHVIFFFIQRIFRGRLFLPQECFFLNAFSFSIVFITILLITDPSLQITELIVPITELIIQIIAQIVHVLDYSMHYITFIIEYRYAFWKDYEVQFNVTACAQSVPFFVYLFHYVSIVL